MTYYYNRHYHCQYKYYYVYVNEMRDEKVLKYIVKENTMLFNHFSL